jgi:Family of unknown function (DUF6148)
MATLNLLEQQKTRLSAYISAEIAILNGQEYVIGSRRLKRPDLEQVRTEISRLTQSIAALEAAAANKASGRGRVRLATFGGR